MNLLSAWPLQNSPAVFLKVFRSPVHHAINITPHTCSAPSLDGRLPSSNQVLAQPCSLRLSASGPVAFQPPTPSTPHFLSLAKDTRCIHPSLSSPLFPTCGPSAPRRLSIFPSCHLLGKACRPSPPRLQDSLSVLLIRQ